MLEPSIPDIQSIAIVPENFALKTEGHVYLDHNATTPLARDVRDHVIEWLDIWGNPSSIHKAGRKPKAILRETRAAISLALGCSPLELVFTSGGSEANNLAIKGVFENLKKSGRLKSKPHLLISSVEHPSVYRTAQVLSEIGVEVETVAVDRSGQIDLHAFQTQLRDSTFLVSMMLANNETGHIFPIKEMVPMAHARGALFHTDAVQALGKIDVNVRDLGVDLASFSGHKFYSLKGSGVLYSKRGVQLESLIHGGGQERHRRGGTENVLAFASLALMCRKHAQIKIQNERLTKMRDAMEAEISARIAGVQVTGQGSPRLPNTSSLVIPGVDGETMLMNLDIRGFAVSTGAACSSGNPEPSPALLAMGLSRAEAQSSLRIGIGWGTTDEELHRFIETLVDVVEFVRGLGRGGADKVEFAKQFVQKPSDNLDFEQRQPK